MESNKLRIIITALIPKTANHVGKTGGLVRMAEILKRISGPGKTEVVLVSSDEYYADYLRKNGVVIELRPVRSKLKFKSLLGLSLKSLAIIAKSFFVLKTDFLKSEEKDIILYVSSDLFWEVIPAFFFKKINRKVKWIQVMHHVYPDWKKRPGRKIVNFFGYYLQRFSFWLIRKRADRIIAVSNMTKNELVGVGFPEEKISVSSNGINPEYFEKLEEAEASYEGVFLGRLNYSKGIEDLVKIWKKVCRELPEAKLAVIGGGDERTKTELLEKIKMQGLQENVKLLGFLPDDEAYSILKSGKVFVFPSHEEGWGIAVAEAMACGLAVVSWDLPVFKEIFEIHTFQIEEENIDQFSEKVIEILKDDSLREAFGKNGKEFVRKYSWNEVAKKELEIICSK